MVAMSPSRVPRPTSRRRSRREQRRWHPPELFWDGNAPPAEATRRISHSSSSASSPANDDVRNVVLSANGRYATYSPLPLPTSSPARRAERRRTSTSGTAMHPLSQGIASSRTMQGALGSGKQGLVGAADQQRRSLPRVPQPAPRIWSQDRNQLARQHLPLGSRGRCLGVRIRLVSHTPLSSPPTGGDGYSFDNRISGGGRFVTFTTSSTDLGPDPVRGVIYAAREPNPSGAGLYGLAGSGPPVPPPPPTNIYIWDRDAPTATANQRVSIPDEREGDQHDVHANESVVSDDGRYVAYRSFTRDLTRGLLYPVLPPTDIFLWDREAPRPSAHRLVSHSTEGLAVSSNAEALQPALSGDGSVVAFTSTATDLVFGDLYFTGKSSPQAHSGARRRAGLRPEQFPSVASRDR